MWCAAALMSHPSAAIATTAIAADRPMPNLNTTTATPHTHGPCVSKERGTHNHSHTQPHTQQRPVPTVDEDFGIWVVAHSTLHELRAACEVFFRRCKAVRCRQTQLGDPRGIVLGAAMVKKTRTRQSRQHACTWAGSCYHIHWSTPLPAHVDHMGHAKSLQLRHVRRKRQRTEVYMV